VALPLSYRGPSRYAGDRLLTKASRLAKREIGVVRRTYLPSGAEDSRQHPARNVLTLEAARGEFVVREGRKVTVERRHGARLADVGQNLGHRSEQPGNGGEQDQEHEHQHWSQYL